MDPELAQLVELFGQPGAGKTSLAYAAARELAMDRPSSLGALWKQSSIFLRFAFLVRTLLDGPLLILAIQLAMAERLFRANSLSRISRLLIESHWIRSQPGKHLLSEGFLQDLWSIHYSAGRLRPDPRRLAPLIRRLYRGLDAQIIYLHVDPGTAFDRIRGRANGMSRLDRLSDADLRRQLEATAELPNRLVEAAKLAGIRVHTRDASMPLEQTVTFVREAMQQPAMSKS